ncbi:hypothetical protein [Actinoalloteichus hymeniacidonis]|uniref:Uncharacterized protein n=1 Tax=Actinoalloteichus hymeniacidonis TaxID=340345 RepID=A0AAC9HVA7_9PSEU|nr:hypothetical protein [Actinoalloteichus hymeniacidonis]AOS66083.1 hypothetical protein TL08_26570 [Actinoalloteichus hymeniacidonis]MBB5905813.1 hypothetical protein [Actinoalloteichus hymeniacidonis]
MRRWWQALAAALVVTGGGIAVNIATESVDNVLAWVAVGVATLAGAGITLWTGRDDGKQHSAEDAPAGEPHGRTTHNSIHGDVSGSVIQAGEVRGGVSFNSPPRTVQQRAEARDNAVIQQAGGDINRNRRGDDSG